MSTSLQCSINGLISAPAIPSEPNPPQSVYPTARDLGMMLSSPVASSDESTEEWVRHRAKIVTALAPIGDLETLAAEDAAHLLWRLDRCRRFEVKAIRRADEGLDAEVEAMVKNPKLAGTKTEKVLAQKLKPYYDRRGSQRFREDPEGWEENEQFIRAELAKLRELRTIPNDQDSKENRAQEGFLRRAHKEAMAEFRRYRKDRLALAREQQQPSVSKRANKPLVKSAPAVEQLAEPEPVTPNGIATTIAKAEKVEQAAEILNSTNLRATQAHEAPTHSKPTAVAPAAPATVQTQIPTAPSTPITLDQNQATVPDPIGSEAPKPILQTPIIRQQDGKWVGLGGIPILYEKPKSPPPQ